jgi:valyl-tRNA synthetase
MKEIPKKYDISAAEEKWIKFWSETNIYDSQVNPGKKKYSIVIPPPNVTGVLHIGHILNNTIQDIYARWKRMQGYETCWVVGMDHAGIGTQQVVEKYLASKGESKHDYGREGFIELTWQWKEKYGGHILKQLRRLGASVDWSKERFTMDEGLSKAVKEVFVDLYKKGLIYRGKRIVNWDPKLQTAVSDDEIVHKERTDKLYFIKYKLAGSEKYLTVATTRPETMFGDTAVAVHPEDERYKSFAGKKVILPIVNKEIPVVADDYVDIEFGTGALKITPAHDKNDFEVGKRHNLQIINVLTKDSKLNEHGLEFEGMDIFAARKKIVEKLQAEDLIEKIEDYTHNVAYGDRSDAVIEPYLSDQWFVSMKKLAEPAIKVVENGEIKFHPEKWEKTYFNWMRNVQDWCISRQLWWGHRIPIWYHNGTGEIYCETEPPKDIGNWTQDPDVLDTWFSSWLWPFSVFGWENSPKDKENEQLNYYYPTDFLSTGAEIIYLWVARMIMSGLEYMKQIPFKDVYFHSIVRDGQGRKMSKSLGNSPEPMDLMDKYGTDALRFTIVYLAPLGNDILFDEAKTEIGRNFVTKLWNAGRFLMMNYENIYGSDEYGNQTAEDDLIDKWIESRFNSTLRDIDKNLNTYRLNEYTKSIYSFVWSDFCDWYIELLKIKVNRDKASAKRTISRAIEMYDSILRILHPVIPFVTEELWHLIKEGREEQSISRAEFPAINGSKIDEAVEREFESLKEIVINIRNLRAESEVPPSKKGKVLIKYDNAESKKIIDDFGSYIMSLANLESLEAGSSLKEKEENMAARVITNFEIYLMLEGLVDASKQKEKFTKEIENLEKYLQSLDKKLSNEKFLEKASPKVIESERAKQKETIEKLEKLRAKL